MEDVKINTRIFNAIKEFTVKQAGINEDTITMDCCLKTDLDIYGDDAVEYIIAFGKQFNVDVSKFMAADYFSPEGDFILPTIISLFTGKKKSQQKDLTIKHLIKAIETGRLDEDVINS